MKHRTLERGAAHVLALVGFLLLVGAVGFVGYNALQRNMANAGSKTTVGTVNTPTSGKPSTYKYGAAGLCRIYGNLNMKVDIATNDKRVITVKSGGKLLASVIAAREKVGS